jgi:hypothetical protein
MVLFAGGGRVQWYQVLCVSTKRFNCGNSLERVCFAEVMERGLSLCDGALQSRTSVAPLNIASLARITWSVLATFTRLKPHSGEA